MSNILVIAPHADDETLGCGGFLLKSKARGRNIHWLVVTNPSMSSSYSSEFKAQRQKSIQSVSTKFGFSTTRQLDFAPASLTDNILGELVEQIKATIESTQADCVLVPFSGDIHSDHRITHTAAIAACKWFRSPSVKEVLAYETLSETDVSTGFGGSPFVPNFFVDVTEQFSRKLDIVSEYGDQLAEFPFPRSAKALEALANSRGASCGFKFAEAFMILRRLG